MRRRILGCLCAIALLARGASGEAQIREPGQHRTRVEFEGHVSAFNPLYCHVAGYGGGARIGIPLIGNGFVNSINNSVALSVGADFFANTDVRCRSTAVHVPAALQWNFFLSDQWSVFFEPTLMVTIPVNTGNCAFGASGSNERGCDEVLFMGGASIGARWHFNGQGRYPTVLLRLGFPVGANLGMSF